MFKSIILKIPTQESKISHLLSLPYEYLPNESSNQKKLIKITNVDNIEVIKVPINILSCSPVITAMFSGPFVESNQNNLVLNGSHFAQKLFFQYAMHEYVEKNFNDFSGFDVSSCIRCTNLFENTITLDFIWKDMISLWVMADMYLVESLQIEIVKWMNGYIWDYVDDYKKFLAYIEEIYKDGCEDAFQDIIMKLFVRIGQEGVKSFYSIVMNDFVENMMDDYGINVADSFKNALNLHCE